MIEIFVLQFTSFNDGCFEARDIKRFIGPGYDGEIFNST